MVLSAVSGSANTPVKVALASSTSAVSITASVPNNSTVEQSVRSYFSDLPVMVNVAWCESRFRQFEPDGSVFRGTVDDQDVGVMQINEHYHLDSATAENYNLYTVDGNMAYARQLYEKFGTVPWNSSKACWGKMDSGVPTQNGLAMATS